MALALFLVVLIYLALAALLVTLIIVSLTGDGNPAFAAWWALVLFGLGIVIRQQLAGVERAAVRAAGAKLVGPGEEPGVVALVARLAAQADLPRPRVALAHSWAPNAIAVGLTPERAIVVVTTELLRRLDDQELEAVVAHELVHVANHDGAVMTFVSGPAVLGSRMWHAEDERGKFLFLYYAPAYVVGLLLQWILSRYREYGADRGACLLTGAPEALQSALVKISGVEPRGDLRGGAAISAFCIVPAQRRLRWWLFYRRFEMFMDHPPVDKRLRRLEEIAREMGRPAR